MEDPKYWRYINFPTNVLRKHIDPPTVYRLTDLKEGDLSKELVTWMRKRGLTLRVGVFIDRVANSESSYHADVNADGSYVPAAINILLHGNNGMEFYENNIPGKFTHYGGFTTLTWSNTGDNLTPVSVAPLDRPTLVRTSVCHHVLATEQPRRILSLRFNEWSKLSWEEIVESLKDDFPIMN